MMQSHAKLPPSLIAGGLSPTKDCKTSKTKGIIMDLEDAETTGDGDEDLPGEDQILRSICSLLEEDGEDEDDLVMVVVTSHTPGLLGSF